METNIFRYYIAYRTQSLIALLCTVASLSVFATASAQSFLNRDGYEAGILFEEQPVEWGLHFDRNQARASNEFGKQSWAMHATPGEMQWMRFVSLGFSDERFKNGNTPVVDVEIEYMLDAWGGITVMMDTERGSIKVAEGWGGGSQWKTIKFRIVDAYFGGRNHNSPKNEVHSDFADIRIYGVNKAPLIRSIKVTGYDRTNVTDWSKLLEIGNGRNPARENLIFDRRAGQRLRYTVINRALVPTDVAYRYFIRDYSGKVVQSGAGSHTADANSESAIEFDFDMGQLPLGPYKAELIVADAESGVEIGTVETLIGVINDVPMQKARPGEFLYGLQKVHEPTRGHDREWLELMGVDLIRGWASGPILADKLREQAPVLKMQGITPMVIIDPPKPGTFIEYNPDGFPEGERARQVAEMTDELTPLAAELKDYITYWEIGNEPDLRAFYSGPVEEYVETFKEMREAIKKGNPDAIVMNGGLCYFGDDGKRRAKIIVDSLAPDGVDAWAMHAHGPYAESQRRIFERMRSEVLESGPIEKPFVDTESGVAARSDSQLYMQAATCIQKIVYAQSEDMLTLAWFALHMGTADWEYTNTVNMREPRPVILAYRTMVQQLRFRQFDRKLDFQDESLEGYTFTTDVDDYEVAVLWRNGKDRKSAFIRLAESADDLNGVTLIDMFGNERIAEPMTNGVIEVALSSEPVFVRWQNLTDFKLSGIASPLQVPNPIQLAEGSTVSVPVTLRNLATEEKTYELLSTVVSHVPVEVEAVVPVKLAAGESLDLMLSVISGRAPAQVQWPIAWKVFGERSKRLQYYDLGGLSHIPEEIDGLPGQWIFSDKGVIKMNELMGGHQERDTAVMLGLVYAPEAVTIHTGASADWWYEYYLNGQKVYDTLAGGNQGGLMLNAHTFDLKLKKGYNLIALKVMSGMNGWQVITGSGYDLQLELNPGKPMDRLESAIKVDGHEMAQQISTLRFARPVASYWRGMAKTLNDLPPVARIDGNSITNFHEKHPDSSRWYGGEQDLNALVWLYQDGENLRLSVLVEDDQLVGEANAAEAGDRDGLKVIIHAQSGLDRVFEITADGLAAASNDPGSSLGASVIDGKILYQLILPLDIFDEKFLRLEISVNDSDAGYLKQSGILQIERVLP